MSDQEKNSIVDDLYFQLYGERQTKEGQALERLSAVAFKLPVDSEKGYVLEGKWEFSESVYVDRSIG